MPKKQILGIGSLAAFGLLAVALRAVDFKHTAPKQTTLTELEAFHGHLGPYVVIGARIGDMALTRLTAKRFSGIRVVVEGTDKPPQRCAIDGLQVATGATFGKDSIRFKASPEFCVRLVNAETRGGLAVRLLPAFAKELDEWFAQKIDLHEQTHRVFNRPMESMMVVTSYAE
ncbi:MAG: formylmethanofuran dehydrogenase subunit E family protein [Elusimicrobiota bacterium]|jgi:formylmethanofuran dehydrogenase subunit E